ncbi:Os11g0454250, partial [Oryza sativa Japonica Group]
KDKDSSMEAFSVFDKDQKTTLSPCYASSHHSQCIERGSAMRMSARLSVR